jgi:ribonuclease H / adenosylcobalamin/alpha-ribazole phosphatase
MKQRIEQLIMYADGAVAPGKAGVGVVAQDDHGQIVALANRALPRMTCNEAEYAGLVVALGIAVRFKLARIEVRMDSEIVVNQMIGRFAVNSPALKVWHRKACDLARAIANLTYTRIPREQNQLARRILEPGAIGADVPISKNTFTLAQSGKRSGAYGFGRI